MKKLFSMLLVFILAACTLCGAAAENTEVCGLWYLDTVEVDGVALTPSLLGMEMTLQLSEDGTAGLEVGGESAPAGTWSVKGSKLIVTSEGEKLEATIEEDALIMYEDGARLIFAQNKPLQPDYTLPEVKTNAAMEDFAGSWNTVSFVVNGSSLPMEALDMDIQLEIEGDQATVITFTGSAESNRYTAQLTQDGGRLVLPGDSSPDALNLYLQLHSDGAKDMISCTQPMDDTEITLCFERSAAKE